MYDFIVVGLGVYGAAVAAEAAAKGRKVLAIDQFAPPHSHGSSHGNSRVIRQTTIENEAYIPLAARAIALWKDLDDGSLLYKSGLAIIASRDTGSQSHHGVNNLLDQAVNLAQKYRIPHESLTGAQLTVQFPGLRLQSDDQVFYEPDAYMIQPKHAVELLIRQAKNSGATIATNKRVVAVTTKDALAVVQTDDEQFTAKHAILCTGPWRHAELLNLPQQPIPTTVLPQVILHKPVSPPTKKTFPGFVYVSKDKPLIYGLPPNPMFPEVKIGIEQKTTHIQSPDVPLPANFTIDTQNATVARARQVLPNVDLSNTQADVCYYTVTLDSQFSICRYGASKNITLVSACSGHGFKYAPAIAETIINSI